MKAQLLVNVACLQELPSLGLLSHSFKLAPQEQKQSSSSEETQLRDLMILMQHWHFALLTNLSY